MSFYSFFSFYRWSLIGLIIGQHFLGTGPDISLYTSSHKLLQVFQTLAVLEVSPARIVFFSQRY